MKTRPRALILLSLVLFGIALSFPVQIACLFGHGIFEWREIFAKLTPLNWTTIFALLAYSLAVYNAMPQTLPISFLCILLVNWNNYVAGCYEVNFSLNATLLATLGFFFLQGLLFTKKAALVILNPHLRWWRNPVRKLARVDMRLKRLNGQIFRAQTHDISLGGAFIPFAAIQSFEQEQIKPPLIPNDEECVMLDFVVGSANVRCQAKVVRKSMGQGSYPGGIGIQFLEMHRRDRRVLSGLIKHAPNNFSPVRPNL